MQVSMRKIYKLSVVFVLLGLMMSFAAFGKERASSDCQGKTGAHKGEQYCQVPIYALLANSNSYDLRRIATFGYLLHEGGQRGVLGPSPDALRRIDFISCIDIDMSGVDFDGNDSALAPGIYFVMAQGEYIHGAVNGACVGSISGVYLSRISPINEGR